MLRSFIKSNNKLTYPFIDISSGESVAGVIKGLESVLNIIDNDTKVIPGHGPLSDKEELSQYLEMLKNAYSQTKEFVKNCKTLDEITDSTILEKYDNEYGRGFLKREKFLTIIYNDLVKN